VLFINDNLNPPMYLLPESLTFKYYSNDPNSTTDYIENVLARYTGGQWDTVTGTPPQSNEQSFGQGTTD
jgi:hypothetical protein